MTLPEAAARLKHDLGKYVCFQVRWLPEDASDAELRAALLDDLLRTRRGPDGAQGAGEVWAELRGHLESAPGFGPLDGAVNALVARAAGLDSADGAELRSMAEASRAVAEHIRVFCRALA